MRWRDPDSLPAADGYDPAEAVASVYSRLCFDTTLSYESSMDIPLAVW